MRLHPHQTLAWHIHVPAGPLAKITPVTSTLRTDQRKPSALELEAVAFLRERVPSLARWQEDRALEWWRWHWAHGLAAVIRGHRGAIVGAGCARVTDQASLAERYHHDPAGDVIYVDIAAADTPEALRQLWACLLLRLGRRRWIAYARSERRGPRRLFAFATFHHQLTKGFFRHGRTRSTPRT